LRRLNIVPRRIAAPIADPVDFFDGNKDMLKREFPFLIDPVPTQASEGTVDRLDEFSVLLVFLDLDRRGGRESSVGFDRDDGFVSVEVDPVAPGFGFQTRFEVFLLQRSDHFFQGAGS